MEWERIGLCPMLLQSRDLGKSLRRTRIMEYFFFSKGMAPLMSRREVARESWGKTKYDEKKNSKELFFL